MFAAIRVDQPLTNLCTNLIPKCALYEKKHFSSNPFTGTYKTWKFFHHFSLLLSSKNVTDLCN